jgi:L,D-transpeptidase catalytic domain/Putative peptidoglycan binding domain
MSRNCSGFGERSDPAIAVGTVSLGPPHHFRRTVMISELPGRRRMCRNLVPLLVAPAVLALITSCSPNDSGTAAAEAAPSTVPISPLPATSLPPETVPPTMSTVMLTLPPTTLPALTVPPLTLPPTTLPPTTAAPTTTMPRNVQVIGPAAQPLEAVGNHSGAATAVIQQRLLDLGFWNGGADGEYGLTTKQAVMAFQKYIGLDVTGKVDDQTAAFLQNVTERAHGTADTGDLVEVDKDKQLLFILRDGLTVWTFNTSTGNGQPYTEEDKNSPGEFQTGVAITPAGLWKVNRERAVGWWEGDLGQIYRPKYFHGGIAVHGSNNIPEYPASHGCVRVSVPAMDYIWDQNLMPMKSVVWVHGG